MKKIIVLLFLSIGFLSQSVLAQNSAGSSLTSIKKMIETKQYAAAIPQLFTLGYQKKNMKMNLDELPNDEIKALFEMREQMGNYSL